MVFLNLAAAAATIARQILIPSSDPPPPTPEENNTRESLDLVLIVLFALFLVANIAVGIRAKTYESATPAVISLFLILNIVMREIQLSIKYKLDN